MTDTKAAIRVFFRRILPRILKAAVPVFFCLSAGLLILYSIGSWLSDATLVSLLRVLQYTAPSLAVLSLCALVTAVRRLNRRHKLSRARKMRYPLWILWDIIYIIAYSFSSIFGFCVCVLCSLILVITGKGGI